MPGLVGFFLLIFGLVNLIKPEWGWYLTEGWKFRDAEPSDLALFFGRASGLICTIVGLVLLFGAMA